MVANNIGLLDQKVTSGTLLVSLALTGNNVGERGVDKRPVNKDLTGAVLVAVPEGHLRHNISSMGDSVQLSISGNLGDIGVLLAEKESVDPVGETSVSNNGLTKSNNKRIVAVDLEVDSEKKGSSTSERVTGNGNLVVGVLLDHSVESLTNLVVGVVVRRNETLVDETVTASSGGGDVGSQIKVGQGLLENSNIGNHILERVRSSDNQVDLLGGVVHSKVARDIEDEGRVMELLDELDIGEVGTLETALEGLEDLGTGANAVGNVGETRVLLKEVVGVLVDVRGLGRGVDSLLEGCSLRGREGRRDGCCESSAGCEDEGGKLHWRLLLLDSFWWNCSAIYSQTGTPGLGRNLVRT